MGPAVFKGEVRPRVKGYIDLGIKGGATLLAGGKLHSNKGAAANADHQMGLGCYADGALATRRR